MTILGKINSLKTKIAARLPIIPASVRLAEKIILVDVGASKGIQRKWLPYKHSIVPVLFEPNPGEVEVLKQLLAGFSDFKIITYGLSDRPGTYTLNIGASYGCTSILTANMEVLGDYGIARCFYSDRTADVVCVRYDGLVEKEPAFTPDVIKIDVEGYETQVLEGFGDLLHGVLGIETEAWFYPGYKGQGLLHDIIAKLDRYGLKLRRIETVPGFEGDLVCINAYFTMQRKKYRALPAGRKDKFDLMSKVWKLPVYL